MIVPGGGGSSGGETATGGGSCVGAAAMDGVALARAGVAASSARAAVISWAHVE